MCWFNYKRMTGWQRKTNANLNLNQINSWCINYDQYIQNEIKNTLCMNAKNYTCFKLEEKATRSIKKNRTILSTF